jgi:L-threonylcarbamoyladenylate synthase
MKDNSGNLENDALIFCANILQNYDSPVLLLPTETVYGLFCKYNDEIAIEKIFSMKQREKSKRLQLIVPDIDALQDTGAIITDEVKIVAEKLCPGPLTIIVNSKNNSSEKTIGFRIPDYPFLLKLMQKTNLILSATSANISGGAPATTVAEALDILEFSPDAVVDAGAVTDGKASTVVDMTGSEPKVLREGPISLRKIEEALSCLQG